MDPGNIAAWAALAVTVVLSAERAWSWIGSKKYATREELLAEIDLVKDAHHRIDLVEERMRGLPGYDKINEMIDGIGELKEGQAASRQWQESTMGELERIHRAIDRIDVRRTT